MDINLFNLRKMFQPESMVGTAPTNMIGMNQPQPQEQTIDDLYKPEHAATDQFNQLLSQYPTREKPSLMRKIASALLNVGGQDGMAFLDQPNVTKIEDWKNRINPALNAANLERYNNANERTLATSVLNNRIANRKVDVTERQGDVKLGQGQQNIDIAKDRETRLGKAQTFKENNPDFEIKAVPNGNYVFFNPKDPNAKPIDSGIKSGELGDVELVNLNQKNDLAKIAAQGQNSLAVANTNAANRGWSIAEITDPADPTKRISVRVNADTGETKPITLNGQGVTGLTKPGTGNKSTQSPNLQNIQNKAQETLDALDEIFDTKTGKLKPEITMAVGKSRLLPTYLLPGTEGATAVAKIKRAKDLLTLELMQQMKNESKTGATGFGQLNIKELGVLESAASKLDPSLEESALESEGKRLREKLRKILQPADGFTDTRVNSQPVRMRIPGGGIKLIPADKVAEAEARGAVRVQ